MPRYVPQTTLVALLLAATPLAAAPPPGHPSVPQAHRALGLDAAVEALPLHGTVIEADDSNHYTYLLIEREGERQWLAAPRLRAVPGDTVRYAPGRTLANFYSKKLQRTYPSVTFVPRAEIRR